jgi:NTE family protein
LTFNINARDLASNGDAANLDVWAGNREWGADARYFTQVMRKGQWGFSLGARKDEFSPDGYDEYSVERYSGRIMYYRENMDDYRFGIGVAGEFADASGYDKFAWGPYLYFNKDTLDNALIPSKGYSLNTQLWWNDSDILVSATNLTAYIPWKTNLHFLLNFGLGTGQKDNAAYRVMLGDKEELLSLTRRPIPGDQAAWARIGIGKDFYNSWWGAIRGDIFTTYGMIMDDWAKREDVWEAGVALSIPGQLLSGRLVMVYNDNGDFVLGFSLGNPAWHSSPLP